MKRQHFLAIALLFAFVFVATLGLFIKDRNEKVLLYFPKKAEELSLFKSNYVSADTRAKEEFKPSNRKVYVQQDKVNVRKTPNLDGEILFTLSFNDELLEVERGTLFSRISTIKGEGYVPLSLLSTKKAIKDDKNYVIEEEDFEETSKVLYSKFSGLNIRKEPSPDAESLDVMYYGDWCEAIGEAKGWYKIKWYDGESAYVHGDFLQEEQIMDIGGEVEHVDVAYAGIIPMPDTDLDFTPQPHGVGGEAVVSLALQYLGYPYVYATQGPYSFDCSGFTSYIYNQFGIDIGRSTYQQVYSGVNVPFGYRDYSALQPGDILLFAEGGNVHHAGLYVGNGQMIHAGTPATGVILDDLNLDYYANRLAYVKRIF